MVPGNGDGYSNDGQKQKDNDSWCTILWDEHIILNSK